MLFIDKIVLTKMHNNTQIYLFFLTRILTTEQEEIKLA